jgi:hypothetical protein
MLISITQRGAGAGSLGKRLQLDSGKVTPVDLPFGRALAFFPMDSGEEAEVVLMVEVAPEKLQHEGPYLGSGHPLQAFVNTRPYATSALMSVAIGKVFGKLLEQEMPAADSEVLLAAVDTRFDKATVEAWFKPLGYEVEIRQEAQDHARCKDIMLHGNLPVSTILKHLQALLCALDGDHVYWIGREATLAIAQAATHWLEHHPERTAIQSALLVMPYCAPRLSRSNLVEPQDTCAPPPKRNLYRSPAEKAELNQILIETILRLECKSVLQVMPENESLATGLARSEQVGKLLLIDLQMDYLQEIVQSLNQGTLPPEAKRKISLIPASPIYQNDQFKEFEAIILEGILDKLPSHQWPALGATFIRHCKPRLIAVVQPMAREFKDWVAALGKEYLLDAEVIVPKLADPVKGPPLGIAFFTLKENH